MCAPRRRRRAHHAFMYMQDLAITCGVSWPEKLTETNAIIGISICCTTAAQRLWFVESALCSSRLHLPDMACHIDGRSPAGGGVVCVGFGDIKSPALRRLANPKPLNMHRGNSWASPGLGNRVSILPCVAYHCHFRAERCIFRKTVLTYPARKQSQCGNHL